MPIGSLLMRIQSVSVGGKLSDQIRSISATASVADDSPATRAPGVVGAPDTSKSHPFEEDMNPMPVSRSPSVSGRSTADEPIYSSDSRRSTVSETDNIDLGEVLLHNVDPKFLDIPDSKAPLAELHVPYAGVAHVSLMVTAVSSVSRRVGGKKRITYRLNASVPIMSLLLPSPFTQRIGNATLSVTVVGIARWRFSPNIRIVSLPSLSTSHTHESTYMEVLTPAERHLRRQDERDVDLAAALQSAFNAIAAEEASTSIVATATAGTNRQDEQQLLGTGGYGSVRAIQWHSAPAAMKVFGPMTDSDSQCLSSFMQEVRVLTMARHPSLINLYGISVDGTLALLLQRAPGPDLAAVRVGAHRREACWRSLLRVISDVCSALNTLHELCIVHSDVKPANVLLNVDDAMDILSANGAIDGATDATVVAKLCDFGSCVDAGQVLNKHGRGSLDYCAPLASIGERGAYADGDLDVYSAAMTLYAAIAGHDPLHDLDSLKYMHVKEAKLADGWRPPLGDDWPKPLRELLSSMWHSSRAERPTTASVGSTLQRLVSVSSEWTPIASLSAHLDVGGGGDGGDGSDSQSTPDSLAALSSRELTDWLRACKYPMPTLSSVSRVHACGLDLAMRPLEEWLARRGVHGGDALARFVDSKECASLDSLHTVFDYGTLLLFTRPKSAHTAPLYLLVVEDSDSQQDARDIASAAALDVTILVAELDFLRDVVSRFFLPTSQNVGALKLELVNRFEDAIAPECEQARAIETQQQLDAIVSASVGEAHFVRVSLPDDEALLQTFEDEEVSVSEDSSYSSRSLSRNPSTRSEQLVVEDSSPSNSGGLLRPHSHGGRSNRHSPRGRQTSRSGPSSGTRRLSASGGRGSAGAHLSRKKRAPTG